MKRINVKKRYLTHVEMNGVLAEFVRLQVAISNDLSDDDRALVNQWIEKVVLINVAAAMRPDSIIDINDSIFSNEVIQNFVLDLVFRFFTMVSEDDSFCIRLCNNLMEGLRADGPNVLLSTIPQELRASMPATLYKKSKIPMFIQKLLVALGFDEAINAVELLVNNKHLIVVFLIHITNTVKGNDL